ncbi:MAG TPA: F0F1 ATP synthase subunit A [Phycisphaerales bacterium]|nr:F0F1 ATP synthase subunit A [Phycisphaerales bacterium]
MWLGFTFLVPSGLSMPLTVTLASGDNPLGHVLDRPLIDGPWANSYLGPIQIGPLLTMNTLTMIISMILAVMTLMYAASKIGTGPETQGNERFVSKGRLAQLLEVIIIYLRDNVIRNQLGEAGNVFAPFLLTLFFFILFNNLIGLVPLLDLQHLMGWFAGKEHFAIIGGTATGRLAVTGALAIMAFILWQINGIRSAGLGGWLKHYLGGGPLYLAPVMVPVEIMGTFVKPFALALRLFANMTAGHVLLAVLLGFTAAAPKALGMLIGTPIGIVAIASSVAITFLELFVAFLQAFIFMFLTTVFISQLMHHDHDEHHGAEEYDSQHPATHDTSVPVTA